MNIFDFIQNHCVEFINFRFTDLLGEQKQISRSVKSVSKNLLEFGVTIDGSSIKGWKCINNSDILLRPDLSMFYLEQHTKHKTLTIHCDVIDTETQQNYLCDPRSIAKKAEKALVDLKIAVKGFFGPELEFFVFNNVSYKVDHVDNFYKINADEGSELSCCEVNGYYPKAKRKESYDSVSPIDRLLDLRTEIISNLNKVDFINPTIHHHEVGNDQCEIGFEYGTLVQAADKLQIVKHIIKNTADSLGKLATFMPKPFKNDAGSGMHCHISLFSDQGNLFHGDKYHNLSEIALFFIGGIAKHIRAICAFTNPIVNSYKRLKPGFEAPVVMSYSHKNRSTAIRIPFSNKNSSKETRIECRFPDPSANPYLAFSAILMAGIDGILNRIDPGEPTDFNLYNADKSTLSKFCFLPKNLSEALDALSIDNEFLKRKNVFSDEVIESFLKLKRKEIEEISSYPTPVEFMHYINC